VPRGDRLGTEIEVRLPLNRVLLRSAAAAPSAPAAPQAREHA
jgi:hypothetical protein